MSALVVLGHPRPGSCNHAIVRRAAEIPRDLRHDVIIRDQLGPPEREDAQ
ncbi:MAG: hypothetical protein R6V07_12920 [Armatimonadota bacterium]